MPENLISLKASEGFFYSKLAVVAYGTNQGFSEFWTQQRKQQGCFFSQLVYQV